jgi:outer membrane protein OmpA-like peptidoglycan-associated protein
MAKRALCWVGLLVLTTCAPVQAEWSGAPVVGVDLGLAIPTSKYRRTADLGGMIGPFAGYQIGTGKFALTPLVQIQHSRFAADDDDDTTGVLGVGGGARLSLLDGNMEAYFQSTISYYRIQDNPVNEDDGEGFAIQGGVNYEFSFLPRGMALGIFIRRDEADIDAAVDTDDNLQYLVTGFSLRHKFLPPPPAPPAPVVAQAAPPPPMAKKIVLRGVNFDFDKSTLRPDAIPILDEAARVLVAEPGLQVSVEGHTDSRGTDAYNDALSLRRANTVRQYLADHGVDAGRLSVVGHGESKPVASNDTDDGRAQNRRVELLVK